MNLQRRSISNLVSHGSMLVCVVVLVCANSGCEQAHSSATPPIAVQATNSVGTPAAGDSEVAARQRDTAPTANQKDAPPPKIDWPKDPNTPVEATFDHIKFDIEPDAEFDVAMLTPTIRKLFDRNIRIRGYIYPTLKKKGIKQFILVRDNQECCFGPGAALFDCILVHMKEGKTAEYSIRPVAVEGKFSFEIFPDYDGTTRAIYRLDGESVEL